jgi:hypothetical protein
MAKHLFIVSCGHIVAKVPITFVVSVRLSAYISAVPTGRIFVNFEIDNFYVNVLRRIRFGYNWTKIPGTLHEHLSTFYCCLTTLNCHKGAIFWWYHAVRIAEEVETFSERATNLFYTHVDNIGFS